MIEKHTCEQMKVGAAEQDRGYSHSPETKYTIKRQQRHGTDPNDKVWCLTTEWHVLLSDVRFCPFCGVNLEGLQNDDSRLRPGAEQA